MSVLGLIGSGASALAGSGAVGPLISGLFGASNTDKTNRANKDAVDAQNKSNELIAQQNLAFQRENLDYQKALQQKIFEREDSSYQRTVKDMRAAGLSPLAMNGTNGAGEAIATAPLENQYQANAFTNRQPKDYSFIGTAMQNAMDNYAMLTNLKQQQEMNDAQISNINAQTASTLAQTDFFNLSADARLQGLYHDNKLKGAQYVNAIESAANTRLMNIYQSLQNHSASDISRYNKFFGINDNMSPQERKLALAFKMAGIDLFQKKYNSKDISNNLTNFFFQADQLNKFFGQDFDFNPITGALNYFGNKAKDSTKYSWHDLFYRLKK